MRCCGGFVTLCVNIDERNKPADAIAPPTKVVIWMPNLSVNILAIGDRKNVVPMVSEPTKAENNFGELLCRLISLYL